MNGFRKISQNVDFWPKMAIFWPKTGQKWPNGIFRAKSENVTSVALGNPNFVPKIRKFLWTDFEISAGHTNKRTNGQADGRRLNHKSQPHCGGPIKKLLLFQVYWPNFEHLWTSQACRIWFFPRKLYEEHPYQKLKSLIAAFENYR